MDNNNCKIPDSAKNPFDVDPHEKVGRLLDDLEFRVKRIERARMPPEELEHEVMFHQLEEAGFTRGQAESIVHLVQYSGVDRAGATGLLHAVPRPPGMPYVHVRRRLFDPGFDLDEADDALRGTPRRSPDRSPLCIGPRSSPFPDPFMLLCMAAVGAGTFMVLRGRRVRQARPPTPWWQRQLQRLVGVR
jgi:hypothetical protein